VGTVENGQWLMGSERVEGRKVKSVRGEEEKKEEEKREGKEGKERGESPVINTGRGQEKGGWTMD